MAVTLLTQFPTSAPSGLGGSTPATLLSQGNGVLSGKAAAGSGSGVVKLLRWLPGISAWDYVVMAGQRESITPNSFKAGGADSEDFEIPTDAYYAPLLVGDGPSDNPANLTVDIAGQAASGSGTQIMAVGPVAAKSDTAVHAAYAADQPNTFPGPITNPVTPRNLHYKLSAPTFDGGIITVTGTNQFDEAQIETWDTNMGSAFGQKIFKTITSITKSVVGVTTDTISIGTGDKIGLPKKIVPGSSAIVISGTSVISHTLDTTNSAFTPSPAPSATSYTVVAQTTT